MTRHDQTRPANDTFGPTGRGTNQGGMRAANERVILSFLRRNPGIAKAEIARATGLSAQTVARLIGALEADGLVLRGTPRKGRIGQPSVPLSLNPSGRVFYGLKVGRRSVELVVIDFMGQILARQKRVHDYPDFDTVVSFTQTAVSELRAQLDPALQTRGAGLGIAMPFFLWNWAQYIGVDSALMADWQHRDLRAEIADRLDMPVFLQNDATSACSAEMVFGETALPANTLGFFIAFFVGGGLVLGNTLYTGATGNAAGFGPLHVPDLTGTTRPLIELASLATLERALQEGGLDPQQIWADPDAWDIPDAILAPWTAQCAAALAHAIRATQTILDLDAVLIDGWLPRDLRAALSRDVRAALETLDMTGMHVPRITAGSLGADARLLGAASLPLSRRFLIQ